MIKKIIRYPSPSLRIPCLTVRDPADPVLKEHIQDLKDTLAATPNGVALASNQILEEGFQVFVVRPGLKLPEVVINPGWNPAKPSSKIKIDEGCLSIPGIIVQVDRWDRVNLMFDNDPTWGLVFDGIEAQIVQHECEHLMGHSLIDHVPLRRRTALRSELIKNRKAGK